MKLKAAFKKLMIGLLGYERFLYLVARFRVRTFNGRKDYESFRYFVKLIPDNSTILDVGANIGVTAHYLSKQKPNSTIYAFEPIPVNFEIMQRLVKKEQLKNVHLYQVGVGKEDGELPMILPVVNGVKRHTLAHVVDENKRNEEGERFSIPIKSLDGMKELADKKISAIKIDVEGFEYFVFQGALELIKKHRPVIFCELVNSPNSLKAIDLLKSLNYQFKEYSNDKLVDVDMGNYNGVDYFFVPAS